MKTTKKNTSIKVNTGVKSGGVLYNNHARTGLKVTSGVRSGAAILYRNHNQPRLSAASTNTTPKSGIKVKAAVKSGGVLYNNHTRGLKVATGLRGGMSIIYRNHNATVLSLS